MFLQTAVPREALQKGKGVVTLINYLKETLKETYNIYFFLDGNDLNSKYHVQKKTI